MEGGSDCHYYYSTKFAVSSRTQQFLITGYSSSFGFKEASGLKKFGKERNYWTGSLLVAKRAFSRRGGPAASDKVPGVDGGRQAAISMKHDTVNGFRVFSD